MQRNKKATTHNKQYSSVFQHATVTKVIVSVCVNDKPVHPVACK